MKQLAPTEFAFPSQWVNPLDLFFDTQGSYIMMGLVM